VEDQRLQIQGEWKAKYGSLEILMRWGGGTCVAVRREETPGPGRKETGESIAVGLPCEKKGVKQHQ
jgi:hypothetical protein